LDRVVLSGGVFQNSILLTGLTRALEEKNFQVFSHRQVPTNDGGIALGQAVVAAATIKR
jgi:hydrogenase maturation protein HypF